MRYRRNNHGGNCKQQLQLAIAIVNCNRKSQAAIEIASGKIINAIASSKRNDRKQHTEVAFAGSGKPQSQSQATIAMANAIDSGDRNLQTVIAIVARKQQQSQQAASHNCSQLSIKSVNRNQKRQPKSQAHPHCEMRCPTNTSIVRLKCFSFCRKSKL